MCASQLSWLVGSACAPGPHAKHDPATERAATAPSPAPANAALEATSGNARVIHPTADAKDCIEMYGTCTEPPERLCTTSAFVLSCGERGQLPAGNREWLRCDCP